MQRVDFKTTLEDVMGTKPHYLTSVLKHAKKLHGCVAHCLLDAQQFLIQTCPATASSLSCGQGIELDDA